MLELADPPPRLAQLGAHLRQLGVDLCRVSTRLIGLRLQGHGVVVLEEGRVLQGVGRGGGQEVVHVAC
ncbi:hypothetical protein [Aeromicrobium sp. UC242_57]|uniref:hypothetical protein n=1 Tax=Aeromicrobium sp. UC242_57 TaxID=3374624 RepID=UPI0037A91D6D